MKLLAIDTSSLAASVAVGEDGVVLGEFMTNYKKTHSERIMPMIDSLLNSLGIDISDIDGYVTSIGPGSFTGLRIGLATVKAFAQVNNKPIITIKTTELLAHNIASTDKLICAIMDARAGQVYNGIYEYKNGTIHTIEDARAIKIEDLINELKEYNKKIMFLGDAAILNRDLLKLGLGEKAIFAPMQFLMQRASAAIPTGFLKMEQGEGQAAHLVNPFYLRKPQAERELLMKQEKNTNL